MGVAEFVKADMVKPGAVVIDVGVNRVADPAAKGGSRLVGDVDFARVQPVAGKITPNPGGVAMSREREWQTVTVALACLDFWMRIDAIGLPTMSPRPRITTSAPSVLTPLRMSNCWTPAGVQGANPLGSPSINFPTLTG